MNTPTWVLPGVVIALHEESLGLFGGPGGTRDAGLLDSALQRPQTLWAYESPSVFQLAACYAFGLAKNPPFFDGNKRIAFLIAVLFLEANGQQFHGTEVDAVLNTLALAAGELDEAGYAQWLEACSTLQS